MSYYTYNVFTMTSGIRFFEVQCTSFPYSELMASCCHLQGYVVGADVTHCVMPHEGNFRVMAETANQNNETTFDVQEPQKEKQR